MIMTASTDATWQTMVAARSELADQLATLRDDRWDTPSLCEGWRVRDVVAHLTLPERFPFRVGAFLRSGFSVSRVIHDDAVTRGSAPVAEVLGAFRAAIGYRTNPPGRTPQHLLDDFYVHASDVRRPLGLAIPEGSPLSDPAVLAPILSTLAGDRGLGCPRRVAGLRLVATDVDWSHGDGPEVRGTAEALSLALTGRPIALAELTGPGVPVLTARLG